MFQTLRKNLSRLISSASNSMSLPNQFLRFGSQKTMTPDWHQVMMRDEDHYTGYGYGAITKRARAVARVARHFLATDVPDDKDQNLVHPYIPLIRESKEYSENWFWLTISTYLDLEGWFPLMVIRNPDGKSNPDGSGQLGTSLKFQLLNPYNVTRVFEQGTFKLGGYREVKDGFQRDIVPEMIIDIRELNPFSERLPYAMTDAARESSFTLKSAGDYTRHVLRGNIDAPGIVTTDVVLPPEDFKNFVARIKDHTKGEPIFGNGAGAVQWKPMTNDLSKSALKDVNEVEREKLFAVTGMSKTLMGIEQSGTTRETSNTQKELFTEDAIVPRVELVIDALNLDYKVRYPKNYEREKINLKLNNPIESDQEVEGKKIDNKTKNYDLYKKLVDDGYDEKLAAQFANGEIDIEKLGKPTNPPKPDPAQPIVPEEKDSKKKEALKVANQLPQTVIDNQQSLLQNAVVNIEGRLVAAAISRIPKVIKNTKKKNDIDEESDLITKTEKKEAYNELLLVLIAFYGVITQMQGRETIKDRIAEYGGAAQYVLDKIARAGIKSTAQLVAESHVNTVSEELYKVARDAALEGKSQQQVIALLKQRYAHDITENRAKTVSRTETNRAFTMAQYDADRQFIAQNELEERAFKQYHTRSDNPCPFCKSLEKQGAIPFDEPFVKKGETVTAKVDGKEVEFKANFENIYAGNLHPNCSCDYTLVIHKAKK